MLDRSFHHCVLELFIFLLPLQNNSSQLGHKERNNSHIFLGSICESLVTSFSILSPRAFCLSKRPCEVSQGRSTQGCSRGDVVLLVSVTKPRVSPLYFKPKHLGKTCLFPLPSCSLIDHTAQRHSKAAAAHTPLNK